MDNSKRGHIPMQERLDLNKTKGASTPKEVKRMKNIPYASAMGSIINPKAKLQVDCYCDAGFKTDRDDTKSQTGYVFILNGGAVEWKSSKQSTTAMSATEAEYIAASEATMEAVWIRKFISGLGFQRGDRHYHRRYHYVRESIVLGEIIFLKDHTEDNLAYPFTKALSKGKLTQHARSMGLRLASSFIKAYIVLNKETLRIEESLIVNFDESLSKPNSSSSIEDYRIDEPIVHDLNGSLSLQVNVSYEGYPKD
nr:hypothetical protein [Tanacetum cinerariifolium]